MTGLILAGGRSRRFGADKAGFKIEGRSMCARVQAAMGPLVTQIFLSVGHVGRKPGSSVWDTNDGGAVDRVVHDRNPRCGPLAGLEAGLTACRSPWLLVAACDMPFLTTGALARLASAVQQGVDAAVARTPDGRLHPLCAVYHRDVHSCVLDALEARRLAVRDLLERLPHVIHVQLPAKPLHNVNRLDDLAA